MSTPANRRPNAAKELHALLSSWSVAPGQAAEEARGKGLVVDLDFWRSQARAVRLVEMIERDLDEMAALGDGTETYRKMVPAWYAAAFAFDTPWRGTAQGNASRPAIAEPALDALAILGDHIDSLGLGPTPTPQTDIVQALDGAEQMARDDVSLSREFKRYVLTLISHAKIALAEGTDITPEEVKRLASELIGALTYAGVANHEDASRRGQWMAYAFRMMAFLNQPLPATLIGGVILKEIPGT